MTTTLWDNATFQLIDPRTLLIDKNPRTIGDLATEDPEFVTSIATHGVRIPIIATPAPDGHHRVEDGCRRTIAAILTGQASIPAIVTDTADPTSHGWLIDQWIANEIRAGFTAADKARILEDLTLFNLSAEEIAERLSITTEQVNAGLRVRNSRAASTTAEAYPQLDLLQLDALAEFDEDTDALAELHDTLRTDPGQFDHAVSRLRLERESRQAREQLTRQLLDAGVEIVEHSYATGQRDLANLYRSATDHTVLGEVPDEHASCAGHAAYLSTNAVTGAVRAVYVCRHWRLHGHVDRYDSPATQAGGPKSALEKLALRRTTKNNQAWRAAEPVRRAFLTEKLFSRTTPPSRAQQFVAAALVDGDHALRKAMEHRHDLACELLGRKTPAWSDPHPLRRTLAKATNDQASMLSLTLVLAAIEASTSVQTWRNPSGAARRYFTALKSWGYALSPVEQLVLDPDADAADWPGLHESAPDEAGDVSDQHAGDEFDSSDLDMDALSAQAAELIADTAA
jgi:ParB family chromosome partitioning protein